MWRRLNGERGAAAEGTGLSWPEDTRVSGRVHPPTGEAAARLLWTSILSKGEENSWSEAWTHWEPLPHDAACAQWSLVDLSVKRRVILL